MSETARTIYQLVQEFRHILHTREGAKLDDWLEKVKATQIRALQCFVVGVERDKAAVLAGLTLPESNGLVEGKVNNDPAPSLWLSRNFRARDTTLIRK